eukprot:gnl/MRDRNA2_/MRDRNA2_64177_c0_seq1.p1 gnl/MRDRNA2_/MRDRNA2_64177_c0~~gnl/MRDRNA2_/MRDRNA2_64177_c0_seq1.p1  ORF type:complete len:244 (-),score=61.26 gnl/MRDRNA2_/MRDRNA2_64177_c0_seq1:268-999(-)
MVKSLIACPVCWADFHKLSQLRDHIAKNQHDEAHRRIRADDYIVSSKLRRKIRDNICDICGKGFKKAKDLVAHAVNAGHVNYISKQEDSRSEDLDTQSVGGANATGTKRSLAVRENRADLPKRVKPGPVKPAESSHWRGENLHADALEEMPWNTSKVAATHPGLLHPGTTNAISALQAFVSKNRKWYTGYESYDFRSESDRFVCSCHLTLHDGEVIISEGFAASKKEAKQQAAAAMFAEIHSA